MRPRRLARRAKGENIGAWVGLELDLFILIATQQNDRLIDRLNKEPDMPLPAVHAVSANNRNAAKNWLDQRVAPIDPGTGQR